MQTKGWQLPGSIQKQSIIIWLCRTRNAYEVTRMRPPPINGQQALYSRQQWSTVQWCSAALRLNLITKRAFIDLSLASHHLRASPHQGPLICKVALNVSHLAFNWQHELKTKQIHSIGLLAQATSVISACEQRKRVHVNIEPTVGAMINLHLWIWSSRTETIQRLVYSLTWNCLLQFANAPITVDPLISVASDDREK